MSTTTTLGWHSLDNVPAQQLYTERTQAVGTFNTRMNDFKVLLAGETRKHTTRVYDVGAQFHKAGELDSPPVTKRAYTDISLTEPQAYELAAGFTQYAIVRGVDAEEYRGQTTQGIRAAEDARTKIVLSSMMVKGGFWDAAETVAPHAYKSHTHLTTHDHYLYSAASGAVTVAIMTTIKGHITHHGYGEHGTLCGFIGSETAKTIEDAAEWETTSNYVGTPFLARLQENGLWPSSVASPSMEVVGIPMVVEDWIPQHYVLVVDLGVSDKPCRWRQNETGLEDGLVINVVDDFKERKEQFRLWGACNVVHRSAGVAYYLNSADAYTDPTIYTIDTL